MEKIDLTKCVNLRFRLRIDGTNYFGRIGTDERGRNCLFCDDGKAYWIADSSDELQRYGKSYLEIFPRDPETYKDWQVGDRVQPPNEKWNDSAYKEIIFRSGELVICKDGNGDISGGYTCGQLHRLGYRIVLTDIERQIIKEKKRYEPQDGDIVAWKDKEDEGRPAISIYREKNRSYMTLFTTGSCYVPVEDLAMEVVRPATEDEKQMLFDAMAKQGKRWNAEKKVVEDIPKPYEFKKGEPVLVRDYDDNIWKLAAFRQRSGNASYPYEICNERGNYYNHRLCIPYNERTMHLLGTTEDYKEK